MNKSEKLMTFALQNNGNITSKQAQDLIGHSYYHNGNKHTGDVLARMVNSGKLERVKKGVFKVRIKPINLDHPSQTKLL